MNHIPVLIIDDDEIDRYSLTRDLKSTGLPFTIFEKTNGQEALEFFRDYKNQKALDPKNFPPAISFLDINMPLLTGHEFLKEFSQLIKDNDINSNIVMMFTSSEKEEDIDKSLSYPFVKDYLIKGKYNKSELKQKIEQALNI
ncbi:hypothetical protein A9Q81_00250 [Gammaproteobacteria bacterium 42_54_T18]|nr:hypothetical protein A9Q81_00250 [Gammaproteobacteria bacterium 42_54_T18]